MLGVSRFAHVFDLGEHVALWHSLRMKPVFLSRNAYSDYEAGRISEEIEHELLSAKILLSHSGEDDAVLERVRANMPLPNVGLGYFILSENCNLACRYCFVGSDVCGQGISANKNMTIDVADHAIDVFARQLEAAEVDYTQTASDIIFFGGEPLLNFEVLSYVVKRIGELKTVRPVLSGTKFAVITNGTLLNEECILALEDMNVAVSISIDGFSEEANSQRIDKAGKATFKRVVEVLETYKRLGVTVPSLSVTLSEKTIDDLPGMVELIRKYGIAGFGYNVLLKREDGPEANVYYEKASRFIIDSFLALRNDGIYEDRIMRKLNAFAHQRIHFADCGATQGGQILFAPDGRIGICQGLMAEDENYVANVWDDNFIAAKHDYWKKWAGLVPLNNPECLDCAALRLCGGGCPVNARLISPHKGLNCIDPRSCVHAKQTLQFLIEDLYTIMLHDGMSL